MILSLNEQKNILKQLIKDLDELTDLVSVKGANYLVDAKLKAYMLHTTFIIEERLNEDKISKQRY